MMLWRGELRRVFAYGEAVDLRKSFTGLVPIARHVLHEEELSGSVFVFINRKRTLLKALWWDRTGWCVLAKRLERGRFQLRAAELKQELSAEELQLLLDGMLFSAISCKSRKIALQHRHDVGATSSSTYPG